MGHPSDVVNRGDKVKVKVVSIEDRRIGLSLKDVDQATGEDLAPSNQSAPPSFLTGANAASFRNPERPMGSLTGIQMDMNQGAPVKKRFTSPERFEIKQLIASGVLDPKDYPDFDEDHGLLHMEDEELDLEIEVKEVFCAVSSPFFLIILLKYCANIYM